MLQSTARSNSMAGFAFRLSVMMAVFGLALAAPLDRRLAKRAPPRPSQDSFYNVPGDVAEAAPGAILRHRTPPARIAAFGIDPVNLKASHQILYRTTDNQGNATATVMSLLVPHNADMSKLISYQVAEDAASIDCAPSYAFQLESASGPLQGTLLTQAELLLIEALLEQGWVVAVPDFLGPKGSFLANKLAGHATLDGIRAAIKSAPLTGLKPKPKVAMWGYSGGSLATLWAAEMQPSYAPELEIAGAAAGGAVPNLTTAVLSLNKKAFAGLIPVGLLGLVSQYPELGEVVEQHVIARYRDTIHKAGRQCLVANSLDFGFKDIIGMFDDRKLISKNPTMVRILGENSLSDGTAPRLPMPLFMYKAVADEVSPVGDTDALVAGYCAAGSSVQYLKDIAASHGTLAATAAPKVISWLKEVMNGNGPARTLPPVCSQRTVLTSLLDPKAIEVIPKVIIDTLLDLIGKPVGPPLIG